MWETAGRAAQIPPNPQLLAGGGTLHRAETIDALAADRRARSRRLWPRPSRPTTTRCATATAAELSPAALEPRAAPPKPIETPPFFAIPICAGITNTMGGIAIDGHGRVQRPRRLDHRRTLRRRRRAPAGLEGGGALGYVGGLIKACVFGLRVAEHAASAPK